MHLVPAADCEHNTPLTSVTLPLTVMLVCCTRMLPVCECKGKLRGCGRERSSTLRCECNLLGLKSFWSVRELTEGLSRDDGVKE